MSKHKATKHDSCEGCDFCVYILEGDFACIKDNEPVIVIEGWMAVHEPCKDGSWDDV